MGDYLGRLEQALDQQDESGSEDPLPEAGKLVGDIEQFLRERDQIGRAHV